MATGFPTFVEEENDLVSLEEYLTDNITASFMVRIKHDHLTPAGILKNDLVIIERTRNTHDGDIVLFSVNHKHHFQIASLHEGKQTFLPIGTDSVQFGEYDTVQIVGVVKGLIRKY